MTAAGEPVVVPGRVSIVVPTHDRAHRCRWTLRSLLDQDHPDVEVVVVDDASTDHTLDVLTTLAETEPRLRVLHHDTNQGSAAARNTGIAAATGQWIAFCDDDDWWMPTKASTQVAALTTTGARWSYVTSVSVDDDLRPVALHRARPHDLPRDLYLWNQMPGGGSGVMAERSLLDEAGGFDSDFAYFVDWEQWIRLAEIDPHPAAIDVPLMAYVEHTGQLTRSMEPAVAEIVRLDEVLGPARRREGLGDRDLLIAWWVVQRARAGDGARTALSICARVRPLVSARVLARCLATVVVPDPVRAWRRRRTASRLVTDPDVAEVLAAAASSRRAAERVP